MSLSLSIQQPLSLSSIRPAVGTSILNLAKAIVLQRGLNQENQNLLQANQTNSSPTNFSASASEKRTVNRWNPWRPSETRTERVLHGKGSGSDKSATSRTEETAQKELETDNSLKEQPDKRNEKVKGL